MRPDVTRFNLFRVVTELVATAFLVSLCLVGDLFAQEEKPPPVEIIDFKIIEKDQQLDERGELRLARRLMQEKNYPAAAAVLEGLYEQDTTGAVVINLLLMCYEQLGYFPKVEMLTRRCAKLDPANFVHRMRLAEALARQGRMDEARAAYAEAESLVAPNDTARCRSIVASMIGNGLDSLALTLIDAARARLASPMLFALERGRIYEGRRRFEEASAEYFAALGSDSESIAPEAEKKLLELLKYEESAPLVEKTLLGQVERGVNVGVARILSFFYLEAGQFDRAFAFAVLQDSLGGRTGQPLLHFMRTCQERKHFQQVARMGEYALGRFRQNGFPADAHFVYADALVHLGRYTDAIGVYDTVVASFPVMADKAEALYQIGDVYLNYLHDYDRALTCFDSVIGEYNTGLGFLNSILARPHCVLRQGRLPEARDAFTKLLSRRLSPDQSEMATYHLALIMFFEHTFDSSEIAFRKLQVDYPRGFYVNDALQLLLVMSEAKDQPALLKEFSDALLFEQRHMPDSTANRLRALADKPGGLLADLALYKLALLSLSQSDSAAAVAYVDRLAQQFAESYYLPYGMKVKADIFVSRPDGIEPAKALYQALLEKYPNYPFISEVRKRLRQLEGEA